MSTHPWTDPDPQPGDFDAELAKVDAGDLEYHDGDPDAQLIVLVGVHADDAARLNQLSETRGETPADVVSQLLRDADRSVV